MKAEQLQTMTFKIAGGSAVCLNSRIVVQQALREIAWRAGLSAVRSVSHDYVPYGIGVALLLPEAHIAARTWPETGLAYVTMTTCQAGRDGCSEFVTIGQLAIAKFQNIKVSLLALFIQ